MFVKDWMSKGAITIEPDAQASAARALMERRRVRRLPVVKEGRLIGIITRSDVDSALGKGSDNPGSPSRTVKEVMTADPVTIGPGEALEDAAVLMSRRQISGLPVVENGKVVGMITETDVFRALIDILGFDEGGARVVLALHSPESLLAWLQKFSKGPKVRSLVTYRDPASKEWKAVARLWGRKGN